MKKTYLIPEIAVVKLNVCQHIMAGSPFDKKDGVVGSGDVLAPELDLDLDDDLDL